MEAYPDLKATGYKPKMLYLQEYTNVLDLRQYKNWDFLNHQHNFLSHY